MSAGAASLAIAEIASEADAAEAARLMRAFLAWCRVRYAERPWQVETYFDPVAWEAELADLRNAYAPPCGAVLLARADGTACGCVALRTIGAGICEMKRLYIDPAHHGKGIGRALVTALIGLAAARGFRLMRLDTGDLQPEAIALYRALGFREIAPYYDVPSPLRDHLLFMERGL